MAGFSYRLLDPSGSEIATVSYPFAVVKEGETVFLPGGGSAVVLEVHNDEHDQEDGVQATLVVDA